MVPPTRSPISSIIDETTLICSASTATSKCHELVRATRTAELIAPPDASGDVRYYLAKLEALRSKKGPLSDLLLKQDRRLRKGTARQLKRYSVAPRNSSR